MDVHRESRDDRWLVHRYYLRWRSHACTGSRSHACRCRNEVDSRGREPSVGGPYNEEVSYLEARTSLPLDRVEVRREREQLWKKRLTNWRRHYCCCSVPDAFGRLPVPFIGWDQEVPRPFPMSRRFSLCPFVRLDERGRKGVQEKRTGRRIPKGWGEGQSTGGQSHDFALMPTRVF